MKAAKLLMLLCLVPLCCSGLWAQDTSQICILSFDDRNGSGSHDDREAPITQGIGFHLMSALGVIIDTGLLENSLNASRGLFCFDGLPAGDYLVRLTSAQYLMTTAPAFNAAVLPGAAPIRFDVGVTALEIARQAPDAASDPLTEEQALALQGIVISLIAAGISAGSVLLIGLLIYLGVFRRRLRKVRAGRMAQQPWNPAHAEQARTAQIPPAATSSIGSKPPAKFGGPLSHHEHSQGSPLLFDEDDTKPPA